MIYTSLKVAALAQAANAAAQWQLTNFDQVTNVGGVFATSPSECYVAFSDNSKGPGVGYSNDYGSTWSLDVPNGSLNTDTARDTKGNEIITTIGAIFASHDGSTYEPIEGKDITFSQNVETFGEQSFGVTGTHYPNGPVGEEINGVAVSSDGGVSWSFFDTGLSIDHYPARYAAFPSDTTWYVGSGIWSSSPVRSKVSATDRNTTSFDINNRVTVSKTDGAHFRQATASNYHWGAISKTTDGGKTFKKVYDTTDYYFNEIDCSTTNICMAVAENGESAIVVRTDNGGMTWDTVMSVSSKNGENLMGCKMLSDTEAWVSGGTFEGGMVGHYYHTVDSGKTWDMQSLQGGYSVDLSFSDGTGYSPAMTERYSGVAVLK
jgi:hypothetical protein